MAKVERKQLGFRKETQKALLATAIMLLNIHHLLIHSITTDITLFLQQLDQNLEKDSSYSIHQNHVVGISCYALGHLLPPYRNQLHYKHSHGSYAQVHTDKLRPQSATSCNPSHGEHMAVTKPSRSWSSRKQFKDRLPYICWSPISEVNMLLDRQTNSWFRSI